MFQRGRRLFTTASILLLVTAAFHTTAQFAAGPMSPAEVATEETMRATRVDLGFGMTPSYLDILTSFSLTMPVLLVVWAALNLMAARVDDAGRLVRPFAWAGAAGCAGVVALNIWAQVPPAIISFGIAGAVFLLAALRGR